MANNVEKLRKLNGLSQNQLAIKLGKSVSSIYAYEAGTRKLTDEVIIKLAQIFNCSTDEVLGYTSVKSVSYFHLSSFVDTMQNDINSLQRKLDEFSKDTKANIKK